MNNEKRLVPKLRFPEFTHAWEQRKLGEITNSYSGGTPSVSNRNYYGGNIPFIRSGEISLDKTELFITDDGLNNSSAKLVSKGDILYALYGATSGEVSMSLINGAINQAILAIQPHENFSSEFIIQWLKGEKLHIISSYLQGGQGNLSAEIVKKLVISLPKPQEQQKIGTFFTALDRYITIHQRKLENIQKLKKSLLQKMFPKNDQEFPEIRFPEFTYAWEQRKLGEVVEIIMGQSPNSENYTNNPKDHILVQGNADIKNGKVFPRTWTTQITKIGKKNDLVMSVRAPVGDMAKTDYDVVLGRGVCAIRGNEFIFQLLNKMKINGYWNTLSTGSTFESINSNDIKNAQISIPLPIEQQKISTFFTALDRYITIHQRKLENMQKLKKSLLQQMFV
ncbi:restriction endonuclease subunit S [Histophilus somni]|uniref:restriction endonuclease subunit S n=3 Tax=Histophilus somni TaxID=731 RepID=UPI00094B3323|nr:restriction endonuclease subunit S [Histophilus somni]